MHIIGIIIKILIVVMLWGVLITNMGLGGAIAFAIIVGFIVFPLVLFLVFLGYQLLLKWNHKKR